MEENKENDSSKEERSIFREWSFRNFIAYKKHYKSVKKQHARNRLFYISAIALMLLFIHYFNTYETSYTSYIGKIVSSCIGIIICLIWIVRTNSTLQYFSNVIRKFPEIKVDKSLRYPFLDISIEETDVKAIKQSLKVESLMSVLLSIPFIIILIGAIIQDKNPKEKCCICCATPCEPSEVVIENTYDNGEDDLLMAANEGEDPTNYINDDTTVEAFSRELKSVSEELEDPTTFISHKGYQSLMHDVYHVPVWVYHTLSKDKLDKGVKQTRPTGYPQDDQYTVLTKTMYDKSGYQHGHLAPAGDFKRSKDMYYESHYMTNMAPQHGCLNEIGWCYLESMTRNWAGESGNTVTHIISGSVVNDFRDTLCYDYGFKVYVPAKFFKAIFIEDKKNPENSRAIGFIVSNEYLDKDGAKSAQCSIDKIEKLIGYDLFAECTNLSKATISKVESKVGKFDWSKGTECGGKECESVYSSRRIHPDKRKVLICE